MKKILLVSALMLVLAAPAFAVTQVLYNREFENGLTGWYLRDGPGDLPQATPLLPLADHPAQTWLGSDQTWAQVVTAAETMNIIQGYDSGSGTPEQNRHFQDSGNDLGASVLQTPYGTKAVGWTRTGKVGLDGVQSAPNKDWNGWSYISQYIKLKPGTHIVTASAQYAGGGANTSTTNKQTSSISLELFGDPEASAAWHTDWYGDEEGTVAGKIRDTGWLWKSLGTWQTMNFGGVSQSVYTHSGWIEFRIGLHETDDHAWTGNCDLDITGTEGYLVNAYWAMIDNVSLTVPDASLIPEPSGIVALLTGLVGLGGLALRRRR